MSLAYFCLSSLALLPGSAVSNLAAPCASALDVLIKPEVKRDYSEWIYARQDSSGGFRGSSSMDGLEMDRPSSSDVFK